MNDDLENHLPALWEIGRARWPDIALPMSRFVEYFTERLPPVGKRDGALLDEVAGDLYLACACAQGDKRAIAAFIATVMRRVPAFLAHMNLPQAFVEDVQQDVSEKLLVGKDGRPPRITEYLGRSTLESWVCPIAQNTAKDRLRNMDEHQNNKVSDSIVERLDLVERLGLVQQDPELRYIKTRYAREFKDALRAAVATLPSKQHNTMHLHLIGELTTAQIGVMFRVNQTTIVRWLESARRTICEETRRQLRDRIGLTDSAFDNLLPLVISQLDESLVAVLKELKPLPKE